MTAPKPRNPIVRAALATGVAVLGVAAACVTPRPAPAPAQPAVAPAPQPVPAARELPQGVFREEDVTDRPERIGGPAPRYPDLLREAGVAGRVLVSFIVDTTGHVEPGSVVIDSSTRPEFEAPTREAVLASLFRPGQLQGHGIRVLVTMPVNFAVMRSPDSTFRPPASDTLFRNGVEALRVQDAARADSLFALVQQRAMGRVLQAATLYRGVAQFDRAYAAVTDAQSKQRAAQSDPAVKAAACASVAAAGDFLSKAEANLRGGAASNPDMADQLLLYVPRMRQSLPELARALSCPS